MHFLIFDWDGTIMDSSARIVSSMRNAARDQGVTVPSVDAVKDIIGLGLKEAVDVLIPGISLASNHGLCAAYSDHYKNIDTTATPLYPEVAETLASLKKHNYILAVATGKSRAGIDRVFKQSGLGQYFDFSRGADETKSKPDPLMLQELIEEAGVSAQDAIMIGDTTYDVEMAKNAGIKSIAVSYGMHSLARMRAFNPAHEVDKFSDIETWLNSQQEKKR